MILAEARQRKSKSGVDYRFRGNYLVANLVKGFLRF